MVKRILGILAVLAMNGPAEAQIYKWVDEKGDVHYSDQPPPSNKAAEISQIKPDKLDEVSKQAATERMEKARLAGAEIFSGLKENKSKTDFDCSTAVSNAKDWLDSMKDVGRANVKSGHVAESEYQKGLVEIEKLRKRVSVTECNSSTGRTRQFYQCTSNLGNHVAKCASEYLE